MADQPFNIGDVVALKSGGPAMTVRIVEVYPNDVWWVKATWFAEQGFETESFHSAMLELLEEEAD